VNVTAWVATLYVAGAVLTVAAVMSMAPDHDVPGMASRRVIAVRAVLMACMWPGVLLVLVAAEVFPRLGDWIRHGSGGGS
jgi:hypothetical protein